jgi:hypothetical protein
VAHLVLDRQFVTVRALVSPVARSLGVERAKVRAIALVAWVTPGEPLEQLLARAIRLAEVDGSRRSVLELALNVLRVVLAVDGARWCSVLQAQRRVADLSWQSELKVEQARLAAVLGLGAGLADLGLLEPVVEKVGQFCVLLQVAESPREPSSPRALESALEPTKAPQGPVRLQTHLMPAPGSQRKMVKGLVQILHSAPSVCLDIRTYLGREKDVSSRTKLYVYRRSLYMYIRQRRLTDLVLDKSHKDRASPKTRRRPCLNPTWVRGSWRLGGGKKVGRALEVDKKVGGAL